MTVSHSYQTVPLARGKHTSPRNGACVMELASMLAGEEFTDRPAAVDPVIAAFLRAYNDAVDDRRRQDLFRYAADTVGTRAPADVVRARAGAASRSCGACAAGRGAPWRRRARRPSRSPAWSGSPAASRASCTARARAATRARSASSTSSSPSAPRAGTTAPPRPRRSADPRESRAVAAAR